MIGRLDREFDGNRLLSPWSRSWTASETLGLTFLRLRIFPLVALLRMTGCGAVVLRKQPFCPGVAAVGADFGGGRHHGADVEHALRLDPVGEVFAAGERRKTLDFESWT